MHSEPFQRARQDAYLAAAANCRPASPIQTTAAAPLWRALSDENAIWLLTPLAAFCGPENTHQRRLHV